MNIAIFDDDEQQRQSWHDRLVNLGKGEVLRLGRDDFLQQIDCLEERRKAARQKGTTDKLEDLGIDCQFDQIDILIVDFDLLQAVNITGEEVAYILRCFSLCGLVVALNQFGRRRFDLSLRGHPESFADLNIGEDFFDDPGLWDHYGWNEFRPWSWPLLPELLEDYMKRIHDAADWMGRPVLECLDLDEESAVILPYEMIEFIESPKNKKAELTTFEDFVSCSGRGLKRRDSECAIEEMKPRIAAARLHHWLESIVLSSQDILIDAPHLVARFPSLLAGDVKDQKIWKSTADLVNLSGVERKVIKEFEYPHEHWLTRPAWYWTGIRGCESIPEVEDPWSVEDFNWVFCEDSSSFVSRDEAREFIAKLPSRFNRRYVRKIAGVEYHPGVRFSL